MIWYQYIFLAAGVALYSLSQLQIFSKLKWSKVAWDFFGGESWANKYARNSFDNDFMDAPDKWYYKFFDLPFKEKFPLSATALVLFTDGYHLFQFGMKICFSIGIFGITWWALVGFICWTGIQWGVFKIASK